MSDWVYLIRDRELLNCKKQHTNTDLLPVYSKQKALKRVAKLKRHNSGDYWITFLEAR